MLYLNEAVILDLQPPWQIALDLIEKAIAVWSQEDCAQPIKPYLRYGNLENRIIAMPAFLGKPFNIAGLKWIASFPGNSQKNLPRSHSLTILNDPRNGKQISIINSSLISGIRTAAVSGVLIRAFLKAFPQRNFKIGIIGFGPIGKLHTEMLTEIIGSRLQQVCIYDACTSIRRQITDHFPKLQLVQQWQDAYRDADIFITCTTASAPYIDEMPQNGSLHLNVSLRDYYSEIIMQCPHLLVDDWKEVCRENTDIERTHKKYGLKKQNTQSLKDLSQKNYFQSMMCSQFMEREFVMFHPMGMGLFDLALAKYYYDKAIEKNKGVVLAD